MNILVINCGSSSIKYRCIDMNTETVLLNGLIERIGEAEGGVKNHREAFGHIISKLRDKELLECLDGIGHRVVHGGEVFKTQTLIDAEVMKAIRRLIPLAPLHNPVNLLGIELCMEYFPDIPQVAVFDTSFHQSLPAHAFRYALPEDWYADHGIRRYGFHGTSHGYLAKKASEYLGKPLSELNLITLHLGNGASACAIQKGQSIDTSMGFTPLEGLVMGSRPGDIDAEIPLFAGKWLNAEQIETSLQRQSGLKGLCGENDLRQIIKMEELGDEKAKLALDVYCYRIKKYIGAYFAALGSIDALIFSGGVGENSSLVRERSCAGLEKLGIKIDSSSQASAWEPVLEIQDKDVDVVVLVIRTDEEHEIASQTREMIRSL